VTTNTRRIRGGALLLAPIDSALRHARARGGPSDEDAHEARKALKKARAALRVLRPILADTAYRRENASLRDASRAISTVRDAKAQLDVLVAMRDRYARRWPADELAPLEQRMRAELDDARAQLHGARSNARRAVGLIEQTRRRLARVPNATLDATALEAALASIYKRARKRFRGATIDGNAEALHEWRKQTKYLANAIRLTSNGREVGRASLAKRAETLADRLGDEHDLAVFSERVVRDETVVGALTASRLQRLIERRRAKLRCEALRLGAKTFAKNAKRALRT
jgi:CHAD domain-containing protein